MPDIIGKSAVEVAQLFLPLRLAVEDGEELATFLRRFGLPVEVGQLGTLTSSLTPLRQGITTLLESAETALANGVDAGDIQTLVSAAGPLFNTVQSIGTSLSSLAGAIPSGPTMQPFDEVVAGFPSELLDLLLADYLSARFPVALHVLTLLDVAQLEEIPPEGDPRSRGLLYVRHHFEWHRIRQLFENPGEWALEAYAWGVAFDSDTFIARLMRIFEALGGMASIDEMKQAEVLVFMPDWPEPHRPPLKALAPIIRKEVIDASGVIDTALSGEAGLGLFPVAGKTDATRATDKGIAIGPYLDGTAAATADFGGGLTARADGALGALGGVVFMFRPSGADIATGIDATAFSGTFAVEMSYAPANGVIFLGQPNGTRVEAKSVVVSLGGEVSNAGHDFFVAGGLKALKAVIDPSDDSLLSSIISSPITIEAGSIVLGWRYGRGVYFDSGSNLAITIPLNLALGPIRISELQLVLDWSEPASITVAVTGDLKIGPLFAYAEGIGLKTLIVEDPDGMLGDYDLRFAFKPPESYAIALDIAPIKGGGLIARYDHEYRGALALKFQTIGFSAFAILNTQLPNGQRGFSFAGSLFGEFSLPLGYGFFLTGLGGVVGLNRSINTDALREVLFAGRLDNLIFPADPIASAARILQDMADILPVRVSNHLIGPVARIGWGKPTLLEVKLGVVIEIGSNARVLIVGGASINLPTKDSALVSINLSFFGVIDFGAETIAFDATLQNSRVLTWAISGDGAFRSGWAPRLDHIASIGGLHPAYPRPANFPDLRRLSINFGSNNPKITLNAYAAVTLSSLQFGAYASLYAKGPDVWLVGQLAAEGEIYFHALVYFNPFSFDAQLGGSLTLLIDGDRVAGLGFKLRLRGPNQYKISGKVWVTVCGCDLDFSITHTWGEPQTLPTETASAVDVLRAAIERDARYEPLTTRNRVPGVAFAQTDAVKEAIDPAGGVRFVQRAVPLGVALEKVGEAQVAGPKLVDLKVFQGPDEIATQPSTQDFVRGHFFTLTEAERLRAPDFDELKAGFEVAGDTLDFDATKAIAETYDYEIILLGEEDDRTAPATPGPGLTLPAQFADKWWSVNSVRVAAAGDTLFGALRGVPPVTIDKTRFVPHQAMNTVTAFVDDAARAVAIRTAETTYSRVAGVRAPAPRAANASVASYVLAASLVEA
jgi:hypothetical protein